MAIDLRYTYHHLIEKTEQSISQNHYLPDPLKVNVYRKCYGLPFVEQNCNGVYVDGGGLCVNGEIVANTSLTSGWQSGYSFDSEDAVVIKEDIIFIGMLCNYCWGHIITDSLAHIWWFHTDEYRTKYSELPIYYWAPRPLCGNYLELMRLAGVPVEKLVYLEQLTYFERAIVPDSCFDQIDGGARIYTKEFISLVDYIVNQANAKMDIPIDFPEKIYMIRKNQGRQYFCKEIMNVLKAKGYSYIDPLNYPLSQQISLFHHAKEVVVEESSLAHNAIFCQEGTKLIILRKCNVINEYQTAINSMRNLDVSYIDCHLSVLTRDILPSEGPFFCYANDLFCKYFNMKYLGFPYKEFRKWLNYHNYYVEDIQTRACRLQWCAEYAEVFAKELSNTRTNIERKLEWIRHLPLIPSSFCERVFLWLVKKYMRSLM